MTVHRSPSVDTPSRNAPTFASSASGSSSRSTGAGPPSATPLPGTPPPALRLVGLGLVVSIDGGVPLVSHAYAGNHPDVTQFPEVVAKLVERFGELAESGGELTLVYDAGPDSGSSQELMTGSPLHFVGSLPPSDHPELLAVRKSAYKIVDAEVFPGLSAFETRKVVLGKEHRLVLTHSQHLHDKQRRGFAQTMGKARRELAELAARLSRGKTRRPRA